MISMQRVPTEGSSHNGLPPRRPSEPRPIFVEPRSIFVALGVLSSAITYETGRSVAGNSRSRRNRVRDAVAHFPETLGRTVEVRFLLSANISRQARAATVRANDALMLEAHDEAHTYRDIVFLNMTESFHLCAWKKVIAI